MPCPAPCAGEDIVYTPEKYRETEGGNRDKAKGIVAKPMPRTWYDRDSNRSCYVPDEEQRQFNLSIVADKKPYFMRYIYPVLMKQYNTYMSNTSRKCVREFRLDMDELLAIAPEDRSPEQEEFLHYYYAKMPVGINDCVMNKICRRFEQEFDGYIAKHRGEVDFDYTILKSGQEYTTTQFDAVSKLYKEYNQRLRDYAKYASENRVADDERLCVRELMMDNFRRECHTNCSNSQQLCDILLDVCYKRQGSKQMVWDMATPEIIENLLAKNDYYIAYPVRDENGDVEFAGERYTFALKQLGGADSVDYFEREGICGDGAGELCDGEEAC